MDRFVQQYARTPVLNGLDNDEEQRVRQQASSSSSSMMVPRFELPGVDNPTAYLASLVDADSSNANARIKMAHGTTTLAFRYQGGVIVAVDSRATAGSYIASGTVKKVIEINPYLLGTMAGGAADCQYWETYLGIQCRLHELREKERISVAAASKYLCNLVYGYKGMGLSMGTMVVGSNKGGETAIYYVDNDGTRLKGDVFSVGSGSTFAYGVLDAGYRFDLTDEEAVDLGRRSIFAAQHRDAFSGNLCRVYHVKPEGWEALEVVDFADLWNDYGYGEMMERGLGYTTRKTVTESAPEAEVVPVITAAA